MATAVVRPCLPATGTSSGPNDCIRRPRTCAYDPNRSVRCTTCRPQSGPTTRGEIVAEQAFASNATRGFEVEDTAAIVLRFAGGALGSFVVSDTAASARSWDQTSRENAAYASSDDEDCTLAVERQDPLALQLDHFGALVRGETAPLVSSRDGLQNLRVVDAIARARRSRGTVAV